MILIFPCQDLPRNLLIILTQSYKQQQRQRVSPTHINNIYILHSFYVSNTFKMFFLKSFTSVSTNLCSYGWDLADQICNFPVPHLSILQHQLIELTKIFELTMRKNISSRHHHYKTILSKQFNQKDWFSIFNIFLSLSRHIPEYFVQ